MIQAAARGQFDFKGANLRDRKWWARLNLILDQLEQDGLDHLGYLRALQHMAVISYTLPAEAFDKHWNKTNELIGDIFRRRFSWEQDKGGTPQLLRDAWVRRFGDPDDPEVAKAIDETIAQMQAMSRGQGVTGRLGDAPNIRQRRPGLSRLPRQGRRR